MTKLEVHKYNTDATKAAIYRRNQKEKRINGGGGAASNGLLATSGLLVVLLIVMPIIIFVMLDVFDTKAGDEAFTAAPTHTGVIEDISYQTDKTVVEVDYDRTITLEPQSDIELYTSHRNVGGAQGRTVNIRTGDTIKYKNYDVNGENVTRLLDIQPK